MWRRSGCIATFRIFPVANFFARQGPDLNHQKHKKENVEPTGEIGTRVEETGDVEQEHQDEDENDLLHGGTGKQVKEQIPYPITTSLRKEHRLDVSEFRRLAIRHTILLRIIRHFVVLLGPKMIPLPVVCIDPDQVGTHPSSRETVPKKLRQPYRLSVVR